MNTRKIYNISIIGAKEAGKSALLARASNKPWSDQKISNDPDSIEITLPEESSTIILNFNVLYNQETHMVIYICALDNEQSITDLTPWRRVKNLHPNAMCFYVGCKSDASGATRANRKLARAVAEEFGDPYWETSAKNGKNIELLFQHIATCLSQKKQMSLDEFEQHQKDLRNPKLDDGPFNGYLDKLKSEYKTIQSFEADINEINKMTAHLKPNKYKNKRAEFRVALVDFLKRRSDELFSKWDPLEENSRELWCEQSALLNIMADLQIIQGPNPEKKSNDKASMVVVKSLADQLKIHIECIPIMNELINASNPTPNPALAMKLLAKAPKLDMALLKSIVDKHLIPATDATNQPNLVAGIKGLDEKERKTLKKRLIDYTVNETNRAALNERETYDKLCLDKDKVNSTIPLIYILRISGSGNPNSKTRNYTDWINVINASKKEEKKGFMSSLFKSQTSNPDTGKGIELPDVKTNK